MPEFPPEGEITKNHDTSLSPDAPTDQVVGFPSTEPVRAEQPWVEQVDYISHSSAVVTIARKDKSKHRVLVPTRTIFDPWPSNSAEGAEPN